jgi:SAM-dependent methyltransferase
MEKILKIYKGKDLSQDQMYITTQTFDNNAKQYAKVWEFKPEMQPDIVKYNLKPFFKYAKKPGNCLIAGCQSGRDYQQIKKRGINCVGVSESFGLLSEAIKRIPDGVFLFSDLRELPFLPESFDYVYADALTKIPRKNLKKTLKDFKIFLRPKGYMYLSFRVGATGIYLQQDSVGKRYMTIYDQTELTNMIKSLNLEIKWSARSKHVDPYFPDWLSMVVQKGK